MKKTLDKITSEALSLNEKERARLAQILIASLDQSEQRDLSKLWDKELQKRVEEIRSGNVEGIPVEKVVTRLREKYH